MLKYTMYMKMFLSERNLVFGDATVNSITRLPETN